MAIVLRIEKGSELTYEELDNNFTELDKSKGEKLDTFLYLTEISHVVANFTLTEDAITAFNNLTVDGSSLVIGVIHTHVGVDDTAGGATYFTSELLLTMTVGEGGYSFLWSRIDATHDPLSNIYTKNVGDVVDILTNFEPSGSGVSIFKYINISGSEYFDFAMAPEYIDLM